MIPQVNIPFSVNQLIILSNLPANCILTAAQAQLSTDTSRKQKWINEPISGKFWMKNKNILRLRLLFWRKIELKLVSVSFKTRSQTGSTTTTTTATATTAIKLQLGLLQLKCLWVFYHLWLCCMYCVTGTLTSNMTSWNQQRSTEKNKQFALLTVASLLSKVTNNFHFLKILTFKFMDQVITLLKGDSYKLNTL